MGDNRELCAMESHLQSESFLPQAGLKPGAASSVGQYLTHFTTGAPTHCLENTIQGLPEDNIAL